jgi:hypothetical protein
VAILGGLLALGRRPARPLLVCTLTTFGFALPPLALALHLPLPHVMWLVRLDVPGALPVFGHVCPRGRIFGPCGTQARF